MFNCWYHVSQLINTHVVLPSTLFVWLYYLFTLVVVVVVLIPSHLAQEFLGIIWSPPPISYSSTELTDIGYCGQFDIVLWIQISGLTLAKQALPPPT